MGLYEFQAVKGSREARMSEEIGFWHGTDEGVEIIAGYKRALSLNPRDAQTHFDYGLALIELGTGLERAAIEAFKAAVRLRPYWAAAHTHLGLAYAAADTPTSTQSGKMAQGAPGCCVAATAKASCCKEGSMCKADGSCCTEGSSCCAADCCEAGASCCASDGNGCKADAACCSGHACCSAKASTE